MDEQVSTKSFEPPKTKKQPTKLSKKQVAITWLVIIAIIGGWIMLEHAKPKAKFQVSEIKSVYIDDKTVSVAFRVKNIGNADGTPFCMVNAHDPSSDYYGGNSGQLDSPIKAGEHIATAMSVTVTKQGAQYVNTADVTCN